MPETRFLIGEVFTEEDPVSVWALGLARVLNDTILTNKLALSAWDSSGDEPSPEGLYFFRLAASHYREAAKFQQVWDSHDFVLEFIQGLPDRIREDYLKFRESYDPWKGSFVEGNLKPVRDQLFHYSSPEDPILFAALKELGETTGIYKSEENLSTMRALFADDVVSQMAFGGHPSREALTQTLRTLADLMNGLMRFAEAAVTFFLVRKGIIGQT